MDQTYIWSFSNVSKNRTTFAKYVIWLKNSYIESIRNETSDLSKLSTFSSKIAVEEPTYIYIEDVKIDKNIEIQENIEDFKKPLSFEKNSPTETKQTSPFKINTNAKKKMIF